jgi:hypothetical protein
MNGNNQENLLTNDVERSPAQYERCIETAKFLTGVSTISAYPPSQMHIAYDREGEAIGASFLGINLTTPEDDRVSLEVHGLIDNGGEGIEINTGKLTEIGISKVIAAENFTQAELRLIQKAESAINGPRISFMYRSKGFISFIDVFVVGQNKLTLPPPEKLCRKFCSARNYDEYMAALHEAMNVLRLYARYNGCEVLYKDKTAIYLPGVEAKEDSA